MGETQAAALADSKFAIKSIQDLLQHYPRRHLDFTDSKPIKEAREGDELTIIGEIRKASTPRARGRTLPYKFALYDGTSHIWLTFFNQPWRERQLKVGTRIAAKGKVSVFRGARQMNNPMVDVIVDAGEASHDRAGLPGNCGDQQLQAAGLRSRPRSSCIALSRTRYRRHCWTATA